MIKKYFILSAFVLAISVRAQKNDLILPDSLAGVDSDYIFQRIEESENYSSRQKIYLRSFLSKAKTERNFEDIMDGYKNYIHHSRDDLKLTYADSMVYIAKKSGQKSLIGSAYLSKGIVYYGLKKNDLALDNYLIANSYITETDEPYLLYKVKYNIAQIKYYLGFYNEAISLFKECIEYFKTQDARGYLNSLHCLGLCYNKTGDFGLCTQTNAFGMAEGTRLKNSDMAAYFKHSEGVNQFALHNYALSISKINGSLPRIIKNGDFANLAVGNFYIGKSYWALGQQQRAISYFQMVDKTFAQKNYIRPDLRENYEILIRYYKSNKKLSSQLHYIDRLLEADSILDSSFKYLSGKIHKEYDTKELLDDKIEIQKALNARKYNDHISLIIITLLFLSLIGTTYWYLKRKSQYRKRFDELMQEKENSRILAEEKLLKTPAFDINEKASATVLRQLFKFEKNKIFLDKELTLVKLAASFDSNTKYLSKVIYRYKGKKFVDYVNDLRVDYIIQMIRNEKNYRNYTNDALAQEAGFSSTQRFVKAFTKNTKISPSYFLQQIKKDAGESSGID